MQFFFYKIYLYISDYMYVLIYICFNMYVQNVHLEVWTKISYLEILQTPCHSHNSKLSPQLVQTLQHVSGYFL